MNITQHNRQGYAGVFLVGLAIVGAIGLFRAPRATPTAPPQTTSTTAPTKLREPTQAEFDRAMGLPQPTHVISAHKVVPACMTLDDVYAVQTYVAADHWLDADTFIRSRPLVNLGGSTQLPGMPTPGVYVPPCEWFKPGTKVIARTVDEARGLTCFEYAPKYAAAPSTYVPPPSDKPYRRPCYWTATASASAM